jgi:serine/threonine-protein kinase
LAGVAAWFLKPAPATVSAMRNPMRFSINLPDGAQIGFIQAEVAISRDGKMICYLGANPSGVWQLYLHRLDQTTFEPIAGTEGASSPAFSPDGRWIAFNSAASKICKISIAGGVPEELSQNQIQTRGIAWPVDDTLYAGRIGAGIIRVPASGGEFVPVTVIDTAAGELSHRFPQLLPGGDAILYTVKPSNITSFNEALIAVERIGSGKRKILIRGATYARYVPSGQILFVRGGAIYAQPFDVKELEVHGAPVVVAQGGWMFDGSGEACVAFSDDGMLIYAPQVLSLSDQVKLSWMDRKGVVTPLFDTTRWYATGVLSPDGQRVAIGINAANDDIWVYQIGRSILTRVTFGGGNNDNPIWTADGRSIVYSAEKWGKPNLYRKPWDGSGSEERLTSSPNLQIPASFNPDGSALAYNENGDIWILPFDSAGRPGTPHQFLSTQADEYGGLFSPDGRWLAYQSNESGKFEVYVVAYPKREGKWQISNGGGVLFTWSRTGKELFYFVGPSLMAVDVATAGTFDVSVPHKLVDLPATINPRDISLDGQKFLSLTAKGAQLTCGRLDVITNWLETVKDKLEKQ